MAMAAQQVCSREVTLVSPSILPYFENHALVSNVVDKEVYEQHGAEHKPSVQTSAPPACV